MNQVEVVLSNPGLTLTQCKHILKTFLIVKTLLKQEDFCISDRDSY